MMSFDWKDWRNPNLRTQAAQAIPAVPVSEALPNPIVPRRAARVVDIARHAGVGTATVDRVLNNRAHVRETTRQRVMQAKAAIESGVVASANEPMAAPGKSRRISPWRLKVMLPESAGPSTEFLARSFQSVGEGGDVTVECEFTRKLEPAVLARKLRACSGQRVDAVAFQALDDPRVHQAVDELSAEGVPCLTVASHLENPNIVGYVGVDNLAAGRTAGYLMARLTAGVGKIAIVSSGELYRCHSEREMGFRAAIRAQTSRFEVLEAVNHGDDDAGNQKLVSDLLASQPELLGVYNVGGGNAGLVRALRDDGVADELTVIGHNLSTETRDFLLDGAMDIVIHQDMQRAAHETVAALVARLEGGHHVLTALPVDVITRENTQSFAYL